MYVDWEYYKIFYYVAKYQNFTRAARVLGNNQPNITHAMNRLESQLNCVLFIRSNRGVTLTPEGELLYSRIASAAVQIQDAEEELSATATLEHGAISISTTETALNIYLSEKLHAFHTEYPGIRLRISNHSTPQAVQAVRNGEVDFAIVTTPAEVENGLKMVELMSFYEVLVGGKTFTALASQTLSLKESEYVEAARSIGVSNGKIMLKHILPNCIPSLIVLFTLNVPSAILSESSLSFLGIGAQPPAASWGLMINQSKQFLFTQPWLALAPCIAIMIVVLAFNFLGDGLRDVLDPYMKNQ